MTLCHTLPSSLSSPLDRKRGELFWDKLSIDLAENLNILWEKLPGSILVSLAAPAPTHRNFLNRKIITWLARTASRGQSKQGQWAINQPGLFSQLFGRNSEWKENEVTAVDLVFAHWLSPAVTLSWEKITEAEWIPDNLVEIKSCLI